jgi:predicted Na+-dependent transporter
MDGLSEMNILWALLVSILVPFVTGLLVRKSYSKWVKTLVAFVLAAIVGTVTTWLAGKWSDDLPVVILACFGAAQTTFWIIVNQVPGLKVWLMAQFNRDPT